MNKFLFDYLKQAVGEPPLLLGSTAFFAIKDAVRAYRRENALSDYFAFNSPATAEHIRNACPTEFTEKVNFNFKNNFELLKKIYF